jgi:hypothetical protein
MRLAPLALRSLHATSWRVQAANTSSSEAKPIGPPKGRGPHDSLVRASVCLDIGRANCRSIVEVEALFDVRDQCRPLRPPSQAFLGPCARRRVVEHHKGGEEAEVVACPSWEMLTTGRFRWRPITPAISWNGTPCSRAPCRREPAGAASNASRYRRAASRRCTAGHDPQLRRHSHAGTPATGSQWQDGLRSYVSVGNDPMDGMDPRGLASANPVAGPTPPPPSDPKGTATLTPTVSVPDPHDQLVREGQIAAKVGYP